MPSGEELTSSGAQCAAQCETFHPIFKTITFGFTRMGRRYKVYMKLRSFAATQATIDNHWARDTVNLLRISRVYLAIVFSFPCHFFL